MRIGVISRCVFYRGFEMSATSSPQFYTFEALDIDGNKVSMEKYRGKVAIVVNVATNSQGLCVLAFPCNQFGGQEPGTNAEIKENARSKFELTFDFFSKCDVNGSDAIPLFTYLQNTLKGTLSNKIKWNFTKFLIDRNGVPFKRYSPTTDPKVSENMQLGESVTSVCGW
uniref:Glutathione peroxidase n=1 Tax=Mesocestoides corti TaxID=53468 RepID=A0A5K3FW12_MESCO